MGVISPRDSSGVAGVSMQLMSITMLLGIGRLNGEFGICSSGYFRFFLDLRGTKGRGVGLSEWIIGNW